MRWRRRRGATDEARVRLCGGWSIDRCSRIACRSARAEPGVRSVVAGRERIRKWALRLGAVVDVRVLGVEFVGAGVCDLAVCIDAARAGWFMDFGRCRRRSGFGCGIRYQSTAAWTGGPARRLWATGSSDVRERVAGSRTGDATRREDLLWLANLTWVTTVLTIAGVVVLFATYVHAGGHVPSDGRPLPLGAILPAGVVH